MGNAFPLRALRILSRVRWMKLLRATVLCGAGVSACGDPEPAASRRPSSLCVAPEGVSSSPQSIAETVDLLNALPRPVTLPCFLSALARPLEIHATRSVISAQPAAGERSPRIFLFLGDNILSVVPDGEGAHLLEFGEQQEGHRSLKGELVFPVVDELTQDSPFEHLMFNESFTTCALCHTGELRDPAHPQPGAFVSQALRPRTSDQVSVTRLRAELEECDFEVEPERCALLDALLSWGTVTDTVFPQDMDTIFGD